MTEFQNTKSDPQLTENTMNEIIDKKMQTVLALFSDRKYGQTNEMGFYYLINWIAHTERSLHAQSEVICKHVDDIKTSVNETQTKVNEMKVNVDRLDQNQIEILKIQHAQAEISRHVCGWMQQIQHLGGNPLNAIPAINLQTQPVESKTAKRKAPEKTTIQLPIFIRCRKKGIWKHGILLNSSLKGTKRQNRRNRNAEPVTGKRFAQFEVLISQCKDTYDPSVNDLGKSTAEISQLSQNRDCVSFNEKDEPMQYKSISQFSGYGYKYCFVYCDKKWKNLDEMREGVEFLPMLE